MYEVGKFQVGNSLALLTTNDEGFAAAARWTFGDLAYTPEANFEANDLRVVEFDIHVRSWPWLDWEIWRDGEPVTSKATRGGLLFAIQIAFNKLALDRIEPSLHAAAVEIEGRTIVMCGSTRSGKTTLAGWLTKNGAVYLTDELCAISMDATTMAPYTRPLGIRHSGPLEPYFEIPEPLNSWSPSDDKIVPASQFGRVQRPGDYPVDLVVLPKYVPDQQSELTSVHPSEALEAVVSASPGFVGLRQETFAVLANLVRRVPTIKLRTNNLDEASQLLDGYLART